MNIFDKLDKILELPGWTQQRLSSQIGVAQSSVNRWKQRQSEPRGQYRDMIADIFEGEFGGDPHAWSGAMRVPLLAWVSAGALSSDDVSQAVMGEVAVPNLPPGDWIALQVDGDSMDRVSPPNSIILVNRRDRQLVANACYVIDDGEGHATYKRYRPSPKRFEPVSTNPAHEPLFPDNEPTVIGRVGMSILMM